MHRTPYPILDANSHSKLLKSIFGAQAAGQCWLFRQHYSLPVSSHALFANPNDTEQGTVLICCNSELHAMQSSGNIKMLLAIPVFMPGTIWVVFVVCCYALGVGLLVLEVLASSMKNCVHVPVCGGCNTLCLRGIENSQHTGTSSGNRTRHNRPGKPHRAEVRCYVYTIVCQWKVCVIIVSVGSPWLPTTLSRARPASARHNELRDLLAGVLQEVLPDVEVEPRLLPLHGEDMSAVSADCQPEALLDIRARGLWSRQQHLLWCIKGSLTLGRPCCLVRKTLATSEHMKEWRRRVMVPESTR